MSPNLPRLCRLVVALLVAAVVALSPGAAHACTGEVSVSPAGPGDRLPSGGPKAGTPLQVDGASFAPGPVVLYWGTSEGEVLGEAAADRNGEFSIEVTVPEEIGPRARIVAESTAAGSSGMPSMGWADLADAAPSAGTPVTSSGQSAPPGPEGAVGSVSPLLATVAVLLALVLAVLVGIAAVRRRSPGEPEVMGPAQEALDRELVELIDSEHMGARVGASAASSAPRAPGGSPEPPPT